MGIYNLLHWLHAIHITTQSYWTKFTLTNEELTFFYIAEQLAKDLELFAQHAGRKSVNMEDVILSGEISKLCY